MKNFSLRRALQHLRDGLVDSSTIDHLTMKREQVVSSFFKGLTALEKGKPAHLCICGSYGQGKSHSLNYLRSLALAQGYAVSLVQLDLREIPFHRFSIVYQSFFEKLSLPDGQTFANAWNQFACQGTSDYLNFMPHRFQMILKAMISKIDPAVKKQNAKLGIALRPKEIANSLKKGLGGHDLSISYLKQIMKWCEVVGHDKESLTCKGNDPYVQMIRAFSGLLKEMGYKGLILFFDEAEAIAQGRVGSRAKSYEILHQLFNSKEPLYPIFAFTESFFDQVNLEDYACEKQTFPQNYAELWKKLNVVRLADLSSEEWDGLQNRLIKLYADAYKIDLSSQAAHIGQSLQSVLNGIKTDETRFKLKALVHQLDIETQHYFL